MESAPIVRIAALKPIPEVRERFDGWTNEVYLPNLSKIKSVSSIQRFRILEDVADYPQTVSITYFQNLQAWGDYLKDPLRIVLFNDQRTTWIEKYKGEVFWDCVYKIINSFIKDDPLTRKANEFLSLDALPVIYINGFSLSSENTTKYITWFETTGYQIWMPLLLKVSGLQRIDYLELLGSGSTWGINPKQDPRYPPYLSFFRFGDLNSLAEFEKSIELGAFNEGIKATFPEGLDYKWHVQYQLIKSFRK